MPTLQMSNPLIRAYCLAHGFEVPAEGKPFLYGVRDAVPWPADGRIDIRQPVPNTWNDTIGIGGSIWRLFQGTTDPGSPYARDPMNDEGTAWLVPGTYHFVIGQHYPRVPAIIKRRLPNNALVQAEAVWLRRDRNRNGRPEESDGPRTKETVGIHIHKGGKLLRPVGRWSAGCQVLPEEEYERFWPIIRSTGQNRWTYTLFSGELLYQWAKKVGRD